MANEIFGVDFGGASAAVVHQDRLVLAGGGAVPDVVAASKTGEWLDFALETETVAGRTVSTQASGFWFQQTTGRGNRFHAMLQQQGLLIFGDVGESVIPAGPFTSESVEVRENSWIGSDVGRTPVIAGNLVVFLQRGGEDARGIAWNEQQLKYLAPSLLTLSGNVFTKAVDLTYQPSSGRRGDTVYVVDEDGDMAVLLLRVGAGVREDDVPAWSRWTTAGRIRAAAAPLGLPVFLVERGGEVAVETLAPEAEDHLDAAFRFVPVSDDEERLPVPALPGYLAAEGVATEIRLHTLDEGAEPVVEVLTALPATVDVGATLEVGFPYARLVETVQFVKRTQTGTSGRVRPSRIIDAAVDFVMRGEMVGDAESEQLLEVTFTVVPYSKRARRRRLNGRRPRDATGRIRTIRYPARLGWRDRIAIELRSTRHVEIAGVSYRAAA